MRQALLIYLKHLNILYCHNDQGRLVSFIGDTKNPKVVWCTVLSAELHNGGGIDAKVTTVKDDLGFHFGDQGESFVIWKS